MFSKRKRKRSGGDSDSVPFPAAGIGNGFVFFRNSKWILLSIIVFLLSEPISAAAWLSKQQLTPSAAWERNHPGPQRSRLNRLYSAPRPQTERNDKNNSKNKIKMPNLKVLEEEESIGDDLDSLRAHAAKLRREAESLEIALEESKEEKMQRQIAKVDGWIEDLLIEVTLGDGTELLKTVDQVYETLAEKRYSAHHVLKIFERLCDVREQESRSNCSPLMELLVDATGKLDCLERENNPNKRWNHRVERVLRRKLFARDWNIEYVSDDEKRWY